MPNNVWQFDRPCAVSRWRWCARNEGLCMKNGAKAATTKSAMPYDVFLPVRGSGRVWP